MKIVIIIVVCLIAIGLFVYTYFGGFKQLDIKVSVQGGETVVYETITGDYRQSGEVMDKIYYALLNKHNLETYKGYGLYLDNPQKVEKEKLRSEAGSIIEEKDLEKLKALNHRFQTKVLQNKKYITTEFPYKGKLSVMLSIMKVYPALSKYAKEKGYNEDGAVMEIYDIPNDKILYRKEIVD